MTRIEECENLLSKWKAKAETSISYKLIESAKRQANTAYGIALALEIFKRPSNQAIATDAYCHDCRFWIDHNYCPNCGTKLK